MLEDVGLDPAVPHFAEYWNRHASAYPWDEYGYFMHNYTRGLRPPVAGCFENYFVDNMGSPIRSEIWACLYPGDPDAAARMAWKDSALDHAGGEGTFGEMFWAAVEAAAFVESDPLTLIRIGLNMIPLSSHVARAIREALWCHASGLDWAAARERVVEWFGTRHPCHAVPNHAFTILGWLYGRDFGDKLCKAVNCGYDTDCTGATLGALLGILGGTATIPEKWLRPVGDAIKLHKFTRFLRAPADVHELTDRTVRLAEQAAADDRSFGEKTLLPADLHSRLFRNDLARAALTQDIHMSMELCGGKTVEFHYGGEPVLRPGVQRIVVVNVEGWPAGDAELTAPQGIDVTPLGGGRFRLFSDSPAARNKLTVRIGSLGETSFVILGPQEAAGFPAGKVVEKCPKCHARVAACLCTS
jgi:ADP-ribosylglycohydrolase